MEVKYTQMRLLMNHTEDVIENHWTSVLKKYESIVESRAKLVHKYKDRSGNLTDSTEAVFKDGALKVFNSAPYGVFVQAYTNNKWIKNAINYYRKDIKKDLQEIK